MRQLDAPADQRAWLLIRFLASVSAATCGLFALVAWWLELGPMLAFFGGYGLAYTCVLILHRGARLRAAAWLLYLAMASGMTLLACLLGPGSFVIVMFLLLPAFPYYLLPFAQRGLRVVLGLLPLSCLILLHLSDFQLVAPIELSALGFELVRWPLLLSAFVAAVGILEFGERDRAQAIAAAAELARTREQAQLSENLRQVQKLESLGVLAGGIAHDFNNLLTGMLGNASLLEDELEPDSLAAECAKDIEAAATAAADLCRQMLAYAGRGQLSVGAVDIGELVHETAGLLNLSVAKSTRLKLVPCTERLMVHADTTQLRQVVMNLVMNASDALGDRGGEVRVETRSLAPTPALLEACVLVPPSEERGLVCIEVRDQGCGIDEQTLSRLFEPFFSTKASGRGLGLSAVLGIIQAHSGGLAVESEVGRGTTFRVYLPLDEDAALEASSSTSAPIPRGFGCALVVDDDPHVRAMVTRALTRMGFEVRVVADGDAAVAELSAEQLPFSLVVLDSNMPGKRGQEVLEFLRERDLYMPVLFASGYDTDQTEISFGQDPHLEFLPKPFTLEQLGQALGWLLARKRPRA